MREILFRGKKRSENEWVEGSLIAVKDFAAILEYDDPCRMKYPYLCDEFGTIDGEAVPVIPATVGQYTGLTDKNGKKIFEGDIVHMNSKTFRLSGFGVIVYINGSFGLYDSKRKRLYRFDSYKAIDYRVDGNIHDNPELIEGGVHDGV